MTYATLEDVNSRFVEIMDQVSNGEEVVVLRNHTAIAKIVPVLTEEPKLKRSGYGAGKDDILYIAEDFDAPLEDFKDYM